MTEVEDRLRADLPRLAELIAHGPDEGLPTPDSLREPTHGHRRALAIVAVVCVLLGGVATVVARRSPTHAPASSHQAAARDQWRSLPPSPLGPLGNAVAVWTGHEVLVWGGYRGNATMPFALQNGAAYDPATNAWRSIAPNQWAHPGALGVWAKDRLFILAKNGGAQYDQARNAWHDIASLPGSYDGGFLGAAWSGTTLFGVVAGNADAIAVARYDARRDVWTIGRSQRVALPVDRSNVSTVWTGKEIVVSNGARSVWAYDPARNAWRALANLPRGVTATSIALVGGKLEAVSVAGSRLRAASLGGSGWRTVADSPRGPGSPPIAVSAGGTLVALDQSGRGTPKRADPSSGRWVALDGYPLRPGDNGTAVWAGTGLFVWGGLPSGTPATFKDPTPGTPDAAWYGA